MCVSHIKWHIHGTDQIQADSLNLEFMKDQRLKNSADVGEKHGLCVETANT